jgi:hypothetical protein
MWTRHTPTYSEIIRFINQLAISSLNQDCQAQIVGRAHLSIRTVASKHSHSLGRQSTPDQVYVAWRWCNLALRCAAARSAALNAPSPGSCYGRARPQDRGPSLLVSTPASLGSWPSGWHPTPLAASHGFEARLNGCPTGPFQPPTAPPTPPARTQGGTSPCPQGGLKRRSSC